MTTLAFSAALGPAPALERPWTLMVYGAADNNADGPILDFLDDVRAALDDDPGMELLLFLDRSEGFSNDARSLGSNFTGARIFRLHKDSAELLDASEFFPGMQPSEELELDSADPEVLARFVAFGKQHFPARRYGLMIYSHANGCTMCPDDESGRSMSIPELSDRVDAELSVDFLALELCNMAGAEIAYQWRPENGGFSAEVLVAIPNAGPPLDWERAFRRIRSAGHASPPGPASVDPATMTAADFGRLVVQEGYEGRRALLARHPDQAERLGREAAVCLDLTRAEGVKRAVDALAVALARTDSRAAFEGLREAHDDGVVMNYVGDEFGLRPFVDLYALLQRAGACAALAPEVRAAARAASEAADALVLESFGMPGLKGFEPGKHGVFVAFPDGAARLPGALGETSVWRRMGWYTPLAPTEELAPYGRWAFLGDGGVQGNGQVETWFELLDSWYDDVSAGPAGTNGYAW